MTFHHDVLKLDASKEIDRICCFISRQVDLRKKDGVVVGLSGGIDSALVSSLCVKALGKERVFGLILPERESNPISKEYAKEHAEALGLEYEIVDITRTLKAFDSYKKRDAIINSLFPDYNPSKHKIKVTLPKDLLFRDYFNFFTLRVLEDDKEIFSSRLRKGDINGIVAATDTKQRTRMIYLYYHAERLNRIVCGTTNLPEMMQGFFVKYGDGGVDIEPIAHLYKTQVYQLAREFSVPQSIIDRPPSPDTFNSQVSDEEFYFRIPYSLVDLLLFAWRNDFPKEDVCNVMDLTNDQLDRVYRDFNTKYRGTQHLRELPPTLL